MRTSTPSHRLFVALPLAVMVFGVSLHDVFFPASAHVLQAAPTVALQSTPGTLLSASGATIDFRQGTALIVSKGLVRVTAGERVLQGFSGGFEITRDASSLTVAALTTPVLLTEGGRSIIVPAQSQSTFSDAPQALQGLPESYLRDRLMVVSHLMSDLDAASSSTRTDDLALHEDMRAGKTALSLPLFVHTPDRWLLASFHPELRDYAWVLPEPVGVTEEQRMLRLHMLIPSDTLPDAVSALAVRQWQQGWSVLLASRKDPFGKYLTVLLPIFKQQMQQIDSDRSPERLERYINAVQKIAQPYQRYLAPEAAKTLQEIVALKDVLPSSIGRGDENNIQSSSSHSSIDPTILIAQAKSLLQAAGFMFTSETAWQPEEGSVRVRDAVIGGGTGDQLVTFLFDPSTLAVRAIQKDGTVLPYALELSKYVEWMHKN